MQKKNIMQVFVMPISFELENNIVNKYLSPYKEPDQSTLSETRIFQEMNFFLWDKPFVNELCNYRFLGSGRTNMAISHTMWG